MITPELRKSITNKFYLVSFGTGIGFIFLFSWQVLLARSISVSEYGKIATIFSYGSVLGALCGSGVGHYWMAISSRIPASMSHKRIRASLLLLLISCFCTVLPILPLSLKIIDMRISGLGLLAFAILSQGYYDLTQAWLQINDKFKTLSAWLAAPHFFKLIATLLIFKMDVSFEPALWMFLIQFVLVIFLSRYYLVRMGCPAAIKIFSERWGVRYVRAVFIGSRWYTLAAVAGVVYFQIPMLAAGTVLGGIDAGHYASVLVLLNILAIFSSVIFQKVLLPYSHRFAFQDPVKMLAWVKYASIAFGAGGIGIMLIFFGWSKEILLGIFGSGYEAASGVLQVFSISIPLRFVSASLSTVLATRGYIKKRTGIVLVVCAIGGFSYFLCYRLAWSGNAFAWVFVLMEVLLLAGYLALYGKYKSNISR